MIDVLNAYFDSSKSFISYCWSMTMIRRNKKVNTCRFTSLWVHGKVLVNEMCLNVFGKNE